MKETQKVIKISVRNLVEFILRKGDIDHRVIGGMNKESMQLGSRVHRKIQRKMGSAYQAEVSLKVQIPCDGFSLQVEGRADGVENREGQFVIDEIKGTFQNFEYLEKPVLVHMAQAKCYAYIYALQNQLQKISVQMTYCHLETEEVKRFCEEFSFQELEQWFLGLVGAYEKWAKFQIEWKKVRGKTIRSIEFPFSYRAGQRELVVSVYRTIARRKKIFIQAPTGVGKTLSSIFPAVKAVGEGHGEMIFYLTAKTITRTVAQQAFDILREQGLRYKVVTLTAKEKICCCEQKECNPELCQYAKGHYDRVNDAVFDLISNTDDWSREQIEFYAHKHQVCPFEMSLDVSLWADAVICDYNYVFDPTSHLKRFFSEGMKGEYLFLIDEAHNLVERGRAMYSAALYKEHFIDVKNQVKKEAPKLAKALEACNKCMLQFKRECESYQVLESITPFVLKLLHVMGEMEEYLRISTEQAHRDSVLELYFQVRNFLNIYDCVDENYLTYSELESDGRFKIKLFCVNPATNLQEYFSYGNSTIFFSATLLPIQYYKKLLSVEKDDYAVYVESPFAKEQSFICIGKDVSSKYTQRGISMYQKYAKYLLEIVDAKEGNYMAFFPSYQFLDEVLGYFQEGLDERKGISYVVQSPSMDESEKEAFLACFENTQGESLVGFCVMGGNFSEGIDLTQEKLIGSIIVGTGLPQVCTERELLKAYFTYHHMDGFAYAYLYPGMNKVLQSAGRVIRTELDKGVILLLDERFQNQQYRGVFPREWENYEVSELQTIKERIRTFWENPYSQ